MALGQMIENNGWHLMRDNDVIQWINTDPVTPNHVFIMSCTYEGWWNKREIFDYIGDEIKPVSQWLRDHNMDNRCKFDYRAYKDLEHNFIIEVEWYVLFENKEDLILYKLCQDEILNEVLEGIM